MESVFGGAPLNLFESKCVLNPLVLHKTLPDPNLPFQPWLWPLSSLNLCFSCSDPHPAFTMLRCHVILHLAMQAPCLQYPLVCLLRLITQLCPALCDLMDCSPPGSSVYGIFQARNAGVGYHFLLQGIFLTQG